MTMIAKMTAKMIAKMTAKMIAKMTAKMAAKMAASCQTGIVQAMSMAERLTQIGS